MKILFEKMGAGVYAAPLDAACARWGIHAPEDQARLVAQLSVESQGFTRVEENLNYTTAKRLLQVFGARNGLTVGIANRLIAAGPKAIANFVYGGSWGLKNLGNKNPDDGWDFRGSSLIMLTGRTNFERTSMGMYGDMRLVDDPDMARSPDGAAELACYYWYTHRLNNVSNVDTVTKAINAGMLEAAARRTKTQQAYAVVALYGSENA